MVCCVSRWNERDDRQRGGVRGQHPKGSAIALTENILSGLWRILASYFFAGITTESLGFGEADWKIQPLVLLTMVVSVWGGKYLRIPAHSFMAPMFASLTMNLVFDIQLRLTDLVLISGQYFLGWSIASRFKGVSKREVVEILKQVFVLLLLFLPVQK